MRQLLVEYILANLANNAPALRAMWQSSSPVPHFFLDDLLPQAEAEAVFRSFPTPGQLVQRNSIRERKHVGVDLPKYESVIVDILMAFQDPAVVKLIEEITGYLGAEADPTLYASGVSLMTQGDFLNPHLDNSHDADRKRYRVLNLLYYCTPDWQLADGGNLELWEEGIRAGHTITSKFNRLVVMGTDKNSWHSVSQVQSDRARNCISNYYFSEHCPADQEYFHVTTFRGRPEQPLKGVVLRVDGMVRNGVRRVFPSGLVKSKHQIDTEKT